jgi:2''-5'' RNA ligase
VAIEIPREIARSTHEAIEPLRLALAKARWTPIENWHVTVRFLGATPRAHVDQVSKRLGAVAAGVVPFSTRLTGLGAFPSSAGARVIWAGLDDRAGRMAELALAVDAGLSGEDHRSSRQASRPFIAHMTVARIDPAVRLPSSFTEITVPTYAFTVRELILYRSHIVRPAPRYEAIARFPLEG